MEERLQKYMARCNVASRRKSEDIILKGRVKVDGIIIKELGFKLDPNFTTVEVDGKIIKPVKEYIYIMLNKPKSYLTTTKDSKNRSIVLDLLPDIKDRIYPVGRLDYDSEGLLLLTNDGEFAYRLTHPKYEIDKTYYVITNGFLNSENLNLIQNGILISGKKTYPAKVEVIDESLNKSSYRVKIHEGRNRQIRKMFEYVGLDVLYLKREKIGNLSLNSLEVGDYRFLDNLEIEKLKKLVNL